jgi:hypothetical protein
MKKIQTIPYPDYSTAERDLLTDVIIGYKILNTTNGKFQIWDGAEWIDIGGGGSTPDTVKRYKAIVSYTNAGGLIVTPLKNDFTNLTVEIDGPGELSIWSTEGFPKLKTLCFLQVGTEDAKSVEWQFYPLASGVVRLVTSRPSFYPEPEPLLENASISIEVYP